jgi:hypothetical protein
MLNLVTLYNIYEMSGECVDNIAVGQTKSCTIVFDDVPIGESAIPQNGNMTIFDNGTSRTIGSATQPGTTITKPPQGTNMTDFLSYENFNVVGFQLQYASGWEIIE